MYAVIRTGGKQYRVEPGQRIRVERLPGSPGETVDLTDVLMVGGEGALAVGTPVLDNARVTAEIMDQGRDRKVLSFKYKAKTRSRKLHGHRQLRTLLSIREIQGPDGQRASAPARRPAKEN